MHAFLRSRLVQSQAHLKMYIDKNRDRDTAKANLIAVAVIPMLRSLLKTGKLNMPSLLSSNASAPGCSICLIPTQCAHPIEYEPSLVQMDRNYSYAHKPWWQLAYKLSVSFLIKAEDPCCIENSLPKALMRA